MRVSNWGNSLGVRLPRALVDNLGLKPGDDLEISTKGTTTSSNVMSPWATGRSDSRTNGRREGANRAR